ncbi:hypothetical protein E2P81_ATG07664 [Venturia nashicola]|nr:hypothetical protein E2P81_ATG07664 [Venturia nashicola]
MYMDPSISFPNHQIHVISNSGNLGCDLIELLRVIDDFQTAGSARIEIDIDKFLAKRFLKCLWKSLV